MNGKIYFHDIQDVARFLKEFTGSTAIFTVRNEVGNIKGYSYFWVLEFNGGY